MLLSLVESCLPLSKNLKIFTIQHLFHKFKYKQLIKKCLNKQFLQ